MMVGNGTPGSVGPVESQVGCQSFTLEMLVAKPSEAEVVEECFTQAMFHPSHAVVLLEGSTDITTTMACQVAKPVRPRSDAAGAAGADLILRPQPLGSGSEWL